MIWVIGGIVGGLQKKWLTIRIKMMDKQKQEAITNAEIYINPITSAAITINHLHHQFLDVATIGHELSDSFSKVRKDNLRDVEAILFSQAQTLNIFFHQCLSRVADTKFLNQIQVMSDLALRAQNNCRKTLATLADIKNPKRAMFIKQQNNAIGNQQINNSEKINIPENELLEKQNDQQRLDTGATLETIPANSQMETVEISWGKDSGRKKHKQNECG